MTAYIIVSISAIYEDIFSVFFELLKHNWPDCKWDIIEISDMTDTVYGKHHIKKEKDDTIPDCIYRASEKYPADFYIFFLGDAFITRSVNNENVEKLLVEMKKGGFEYCNLFKNPTCKSDSFYMKLKKTESYGVQFIAFIATRYFINKEFKESVTDFEFEQKHLITASKAKRGYYDEYIVADKRLFGILHGINKGCWIRKAYRFLQRKYPDILLGSREKQSLKIEIYEEVARLSSRLLTTRTRSKIRRIINRMSKKRFYTDY